MSNQVEIANIALTVLGADTITTIGDGTKEANAITTLFDPAKDSVLRDFPWNFARKRLFLPKMASVPLAPDFTATFELPSDYRGGLLPIDDSILYAIELDPISLTRVVVSNQDESLNADIVTNGAFGSDSDWTKGTGWTIGSDVATSDASQTGDSDLSQDMDLVDETWYKVSYDLTVSAGGISILTGSTGMESRQREAAGSYVEALKTSSTGDDTLYIRADVDFAGTITNVVVKAMNGGFACKYTRAVESESDMDPAFVQAFAMFLGHELVTPLTNTSADRERMLNLYRLAVQRAWRANSIERTNPKPSMDSWLAAR